MSYKDDGKEKIALHTFCLDGRDRDPYPSANVNENGVKSVVTVT